MLSENCSAEGAAWRFTPGQRVLLAGRDHSRRVVAAGCLEREDFFDGDGEERHAVSGTGTTAQGSWFQNRARRDVPTRLCIMHLKPRFGGAFFFSEIWGSQRPPFGG